MAPYEPWHFMALSQIVNENEVAARKVARFYKDGVGRTMFFAGTPIATAGIVMPWRRVGYAWAILTPIAKRYPHSYFVHQAVENHLAEFIIGLNMQRVEANVEATFVVGQRWLERLGFVSEGETPCFGPNGEDFKRYAIVRR